MSESPAVASQGVERVEQAAERIVHFMRHAGSQFAEHRVFLLLGKMRREILAFADGPRHRVEPVEDLTELAGEALSVLFGYRLDIALREPVRHSLSGYREAAACA